MRILFAGCGKNGFLSKNIKFNKYLWETYTNKPEEIFYSGSEFDLTNKEQTHTLFAVAKPNIVIFTGAVCGGIGANMKRPATFIRDNILMGVNILDMCVKFNIDYLITLGSVCMYPLNCPIPFKETDIFNGRSESTNESYGESKKNILTMQNAYRKQYGLKSIMLLPINLMGPNDHFDLENSHVIPALINKFVDAVENNKPIVECWGSGNARRSFLFIKDLIIAIKYAIDNQHDSEMPINLGPTDDISIKDLANKIAYLTGFKGNIVFTGEVSDGQPRRVLDISRAKELLNWSPITSLDDGLIQTIEWYKENKK